MKVSSWGFINKKGEKVLDSKYFITSAFSFNRKIKGFLGKLARVRYNNTWIFLTEEGEFLGDKRFQSANVFVEIEKE